MKFFITRIFRNLRKNCFIYFIIMASFMLGTGFFVICMNYEMTSRELLQECRRQSSEGTINVNIFRGSGYDESELLYKYPISYETYKKINENKTYTQYLDLLFTLDFNNITFIFETESVCGIHIYFMNENLFKYLYGFSRNEEMAYVGEKAFQLLLEVKNIMESEKEVHISTVGIPLLLKEDKLFVGEKSYPYEVIMPINKETIMFDRLGEPGYDMTDALILPVEDNFIPDIYSPEVYAELRNVLFLQYRNEDRDEDLVAKLLQELNSATKVYSFTIDNEYLDLKREMDDYSYDMDRWKLLSVSIMMLSGIGSVGLMFLVLDKRKHFIAISLACGSSSLRIIAETLFEIFIVFLTGGICGIAISPLLKKMTVYMDELKINASGICIVILTAIIYCVLSVILGMHGIKIKNVAATLKDE